MELGTKGLELIKKYEGLRLTAYKPVATERYYTIGYGHYGADVRKGMTITPAQAEAYLRADCAAAVAAVNKYRYAYNQNQFDALVSFTYNCGAGNLRALTACGTRNLRTVGDRLTAYNKAGGKVLAGLTRRRKEEQALFLAPVTGVTPPAAPAPSPQAGYRVDGLDYAIVFDPAYYGERYGDLRAAFGADAAALFQHFLACGMAEGRQAIDTFNVLSYRSRYADLQAAFGGDLPAYYRHYIQFGRMEGRKAY